MFGLNKKKINMNNIEDTGRILQKLEEWLLLFTLV